MKTVYILIGPKGAGKSYIGKLLHTELGIQFFAVEVIFMAIINNDYDSDEEFVRAGNRLIERGIDAYLEKGDSISFEATGANPVLNEFIDKLAKKYTVKLIHIKTPLPLCLERIKGRDPSHQIAVTEELIEEVNRISESTVFDYNLTIKNDGISDREIIDSFKNLLTVT